MSQYNEDYDLEDDDFDDDDDIDVDDDDEGMSALERWNAMGWFTQNRWSDMFSEGYKKAKSALFGGTAYDAGVEKAHEEFYRD